MPLYTFPAQLPSGRKISSSWALYACEAFDILQKMRAAHARDGFHNPLDKDSSARKVVVGIKTFAYEKVTRTSSPSAETLRFRFRVL